ncbi:theronine dehydrogenase Zn-dependent dehydrogenase [Knoellia sinensis KCTC 19936]|uniref:Theronine dehydrogenase Zn-dependent dehydrogenase n=1 Tax=Knoellia sinensis KCTC 19936 TaxID=1385520 RepID=A0A0A0J269_9MICO|nr:theronine dehydrogenase Zn-dependent dehydrogenase [Knoellia sinensis KCTC 19936]
MVVHGANDLRVDEVPDPADAQDTVIVAMQWGGICGSDVAYWKSGVSGTAVLKEPLVLGHEVSGVVETIGSGAAAEMARLGIEVGTPVTVHPATLVGDHSVAPELAARTNLWPEVRYFGSAAFQPHEQGGFSQFRAVRPDQLRVLPGGVSTKEAAVAEPFGVALHAVARAGDISGRSVLVNGSGPIGALAVAAAREAGASRVVAADLSDAALDIARRMGAHETVNPGSGELLPQDIDVAIEASGAPRALGGVFAAVRRGGVVVQVGNLPAGEVSAALGNVVTREIDYRGAYRFVDEISTALDLMAGRVDVSPLMTHEVSIDEAVRGFELAADRSVGSSKVMIQLA